jgi:hypothetical protein
LWAALLSLWVLLVVLPCQVGSIAEATEAHPKADVFVNFASMRSCVGLPMPPLHPTLVQCDPLGHAFCCSVLLGNQTRGCAV